MRLDGRIDEGRLTNSPFPRMARLQGTQASECSSRMGLEREEYRERLRRWCGGVDINTFEGTKRIIREWAAWHAADGVGFGVIQGRLRMASGETGEGEWKASSRRERDTFATSPSHHAFHSPSIPFYSFGDWNVRKVNVSGSVCERYDSFLLERCVRDFFWQGRQLRFLEGNRNSRFAESLIWQLLYILFLFDLISYYEKIISYFFYLKNLPPIDAFNFFLEYKLRLVY